MVGIILNRPLGLMKFGAWAGIIIPWPSRKKGLFM